MSILGVTAARNWPPLTRRRGLRALAGAAALETCVAAFTQRKTARAAAPRAAGIQWRRRLPPDFRPVSGPTLVGDTLVVVGADGLAALAADSGAVRWTMELERAPLAGCACLASQGASAPDGAAYAVTEGNLVIALDAHTGQRRWSRRVTGVVVTRPLAAQGRVYLGVAAALEEADTPASFHLVALDSGTGEALWQTPLAGRPLPALLAADLSVYLLFPDFGLAAVDATTGREQWFAAFGAAPDTLTPQRIGPGILVAREEAALVGVHRLTGTIRWRLPIGWGPPPIVETETVIAAEFGGRLLGAAAEDGEVRWSRTAARPLVGELLTDGQRLFTAAAGAGERSGGVIEMRDAASGAAGWQFETAGLPHMWAAGGAAVYSGVQGNSANGGDDLLALDASTGALRGVWGSVGQLMGPPVVAGDRLYVSVAGPAFRGVAALDSPIR